MYHTTVSCTHTRVLTFLSSPLLSRCVAFVLTTLVFVLDVKAVEEYLHSLEHRFHDHFADSLEAYSKLICLL